MAHLRQREESIYNLIPPPHQPRVQQPRHVSKFKSSVRGETQRNKVGSKTMGPAKVAVNDPQTFLKKHSKEPQLPEKSAFVYPDADKRRPPVPTLSEKPQMATPTKKDFVSTNVTTNVMSVPKKPSPAYVDTVRGSKHPLESSGLVPKYIKEKSFGKVPEYLTHRKEEMRAAQEAYDRYVAESFQQGSMHQLGEEERETILEGLKRNWEELHHRYQGLSVVTDTAPKKARKERMEAEMKQLERDIELIEKHSIVYVAQ